MGWTPECQRLRWHQHTTDEWLAWIEGLPDGGFGRYTKGQWMEWCATMNLKHGPSEGERDNAELVHSLTDTEARRMR